MVLIGPVHQGKIGGGVDEDGPRVRSHRARRVP
jgi:hypothetical protein